MDQFVVLIQFRGHEQAYTMWDKTEWHVRGRARALWGKEFGRTPWKVITPAEWRQIQEQRLKEGKPWSESVVVPK